MMSVHAEIKGQHINTNNEEVSLPGHNRVSSLKEETVSRDDSIVVALPSNILPENRKSKFYARKVILNQGWEMIRIY